MNVIDNRTAYALGWAFGYMESLLPEAHKPSQEQVSLAMRLPFLGWGQLFTACMERVPGFHRDLEMGDAVDVFSTITGNPMMNAEGSSYWSMGRIRAMAGHPFVSLEDLSPGGPARFGARLRELRLAANLTQDELGERVGASKVSISRWESGERAARPATVAKLANALGCTPEDLV